MQPTIWQGARLCRVAGVWLFALGLASCGGSMPATTSMPAAVAAPALSVSPTAAAVRLGQTTTFSATISNASATSFTWAVNGVTGGNATVGTISSAGVYAAPASMPSTSITVTATTSGMSGTAAVTLENPVPSVSAVTPTLIQAGAFTITIDGHGFAPGAQVNFGGQALSTTVLGPSQLTASGTATAAQAGTVSVSVANPNPGAASSGSYGVTVSATAPKVSYNAALRFLEQSTFGPTPSLIAHVQAVGFATFLQEQFAAAVSVFPFDISTASNSAIQTQFYVDALSGDNQLRQRVAFALEQIFVVSGNKITQNANTPSMNGLAVWQQMMEQDAFGNYSTLLRDVTLSPVMGHYLDMVNNDKPTGTNNPNENYAREVMQLFSIGLFQLNPDGTFKLDASGQPINTYDQDVIEGFAGVFTGWTYPLMPGATQQNHNLLYYGGGPMVLVASNHATFPKLLLNGVVLPANQTANQDLDDALSVIFNHPNVGPFIGKQLIRHLVKSNPSTAYVKRVADVFADNGSGVRGDLKAVVTAILLDPEARAGDDGSAPAADAGHLREPVLYLASILRALGGTSDGTRLVTYGANMGQNILYPDTVFNYFHPDYEASPGVVGPEFEILGPATAINRANFVGDLVFATITGTSVDFTQWTNLAAGDPNKMLSTMNALFFHGQMSSAMQAAILTAVNAVPSNNPALRAKQALYLVLTSPQYQVEQ